jgi:Bacterial archaeo-eukaryotic release factor family 10
VLHREFTASDLNDAVLLDLLRMEDPLGVLSVFVEMPADGADRRAGIEIKNKLTHLEHRAGSNGSLLRAEALRSTLALVTPALERLLDPRASGRGGAVFAALSGPELISLATPMPLASRVVLDSRPFIRPLVELLDEGEPAGVVLTSARQAELLDWRLGELRRLPRVTRAPEEARGHSTTPREQRARRERDRQMRWIDQVAAEVSRLAGEHGWERILISGDERLTRPLVEALPAQLRANALLDAPLYETDPPALSAAVAERLGQDRAGRNARLSRKVRAAALGAQRGALGLSEVVAALNEGRAEHVIYDSALRYSGAIAPDGSLLAAGDAPGLGREESRLLERILERALHTGARITPVDGSAADNLADADGIAALLRW